MRDSSFVNCDLRNRSFKGQNLKDVDFRGSDIRGCDFSYAQLQGANFEQVRAGQTLRQLLPLMLIAGGVTWFTADALSQMIFGSLGKTPAEPAWSYILALGISMAIAGAFCAVRVMMGKKSQVRRFCTIVSGAASAALLGFFYGGSSTGNNPQFAIAGAVVGGVVMAIVLFFVRRKFIAVAVTVAGAVAAYGFACLVGAYAIAYLSVKIIVFGVCWSAISLGYLGLTMTSIILLIREIQSACGTSFKGADLTDTKFEGARLENTDFSGAVGYQN
jgi:hypothetical protein